MSRISALLVAAGLLAGSGGCAQCDHCDDFPAPCTGPNCAGAYDMNHGPTAHRGAPDTGTAGAPPTMAPARPSDDAADPIPAPPPANPGPGAGAAPAGAGETSPPLPTEPNPRTRPGL
jgi:hypothetical protein